MKGPGCITIPIRDQAGEKYVYGHVGVTLAGLVPHPDWGIRALPLQSQVYIRHKDIDQMAPDHRVPFRTKLEIAAEQLHWLKTHAANRFTEVWAAVDGGYSKRPVLRAADQEQIVLVGRLACNAALWSVPKPKPTGQRGP